MLDAVNSLNAAIDLLLKLPDSIERTRRELPLQMALGQASIVLKGWAAPEVERAFSRALEICEGWASRRTFISRCTVSTPCTTCEVHI